VVDRAVLDSDGTRALLEKGPTAGQLISSRNEMIHALTGMVLLSMMAALWILALRRDAGLRARYQELVRAQLAENLCGQGLAPFEDLRQADAELSGRRLAIELGGDGG